MMESAASLPILPFLKRPSTVAQIMKKILQYFPNKKAVTKIASLSLAVKDIKRAADFFKPVYEETNGDDGFVSLEVSPHLAHDTEGTIKQARELWKAVDRKNVMIKIPGTAEGLACHTKVHQRRDKY